MNCSACGLNFSRNDKGTQQLQCSSCNLLCHRYCYGYNNTTLKCDPCIDNAKKPTCLICGQKGLLKRLSDQQGVYIHIACAIFSDKIQVMSYHSMTFSISNDKKLKEKCKNCGKGGAMIGCLDCKGFAHVHCIYSEQMERESEENEMDQWIFNLKLIPNNQDAKQLFVSQNYIRMELKQIYEALLCTFEKMKKIKQSAVLKEKSRTQMDQFIEQFKYQIPEQVVQWTSNNKIIAYCQEHMEAHRVFCLCRSNVNNKNMVQCDSCYEWYHFTCIKRKNVKDETYICEACKIWQKKRSKLDIENPILMDFEDIIIPKEVNILHLIDIIPLMLYMESLMNKLPKIALSQQDFNNLKFYKLLLASLPIQPSSVIELDNILIKEVIQEEFKQKIQNILPQYKLQEQNQQFAEELVQQLKNRGYNFELEEDGLLKTVIVSRRELKAIILQGITDGYLEENTIVIINQTIQLNQELNLERLLKSPNQVLAKCLEQYRIATLVKEKTKQLFEINVNFDHPHKINDKMELLQFKLDLLQKHQMNKPNKEQLFQLKKLAYDNNVVLNSLDIIETLEEELELLENRFESVQNIIEFPINSEILIRELKIQCRNEFTTALVLELEDKINKRLSLTPKEYTGIFNLENIYESAKESELVRSQYMQLIQINKKINSLNLINLHQYEELTELINQCALTSIQIEEFRLKLHYFEEMHTKLNQAITLQELDQYEKQAQIEGFELDFITRRQQLLKAHTEIDNSRFDEEYWNRIQRGRIYCSKELNEFIDAFEQQLEFIKIWHEQAYQTQDSIENMISHLLNDNNVDIPFEQLKSQELPPICNKIIQPLVDRYQQLLWKAETQWVLQQKKINIADVKRLLEKQEISPSQEMVNKLLQIEKNYKEWKCKITALDYITDPNSKDYVNQINRLMKLITQNQYQDTEAQSQLWHHYVCSIWTQKSYEFLQSKATIHSLQILAKAAKEIKVPSILSNQLMQSINQIEDIQRKLKQYYEQRQLWLYNREQEIGNLKSYKSYYKFLESKPDVLTINEIYNLAKEYPQFKVKEIKDDIQDIKQVIQQYNELCSKNYDNSFQIQQLLKIRNYYCLCFLKIKNFSLQLMYSLIKQQSLKCLKSLTPSEELLQRLNEINLLVSLGGDEWYAKLSLNYKAEQLESEFSFVDQVKIIVKQSLNDDFEWVKWMEENSANLKENYGLKKDNNHKIKKKVYSNYQLKINLKQLNEGVGEPQRLSSRNDILSLIKKYQLHKFNNEPAIRSLEAAIFMEHHLNYQRYRKEIEKTKILLKANKIQDLNYDEIKKQYKLLVLNKKTNISNGLQLDSIKVVKKLIKPSKPHILEPELQKRIRQEVPSPEIKLQDNIAFYNPDGVGDRITKKNQLMSIGEITLELGRKPANDVRQKFQVKTSLLTYNYQDAPFFHSINDLLVTCHNSAPVSPVVDYFMNQKDPHFKMIVGWLYSKDIKIAGDLFKLGEQLKNSKHCIGGKYQNIGISLLYYEYLKTLKPVTKWIIEKSELDDPIFSKQLNKYHNLEKFKPHLCFVLYCKDAFELVNQIQPTPVIYENVYKIPKYNKMIEEHRQNRQKQNNNNKSNNKSKLEPISDEDNTKQKNEIQPSDSTNLQFMMMEIPNIMNLLDN